MYVLIGYMGSGKTTVGSLLSSFLSINYYDLDNFIIKWNNQYIHNIFLKNGENYFRSIEIDILFFFKSIHKKNIISPGGGISFFRKNKYFLKKLFLTFYLHFSSKEIFQRIRYKTNQRPLISSFSSDKLLYFVHRHLSNRIKYYNKFNYKLEILSRFNEDIVFSIHNQLSIINYKYGDINPFE